MCCAPNHTGTAAVIAGISEFVKWQHPEVHVVELQQKGGRLGLAGAPAEKLPGAGPGAAASDAPASATTIYEDDQMQVL